MTREIFKRFKSITIRGEKEMSLNPSIEKIVRWETQPIRSIPWNGRMYQVEVTGEDQDGSYGFEFFESGRCTPLRYDPKSNRILIEDDRLRTISLIQNEFPPQLESILKKEVQHQIFQWKAYLDAQKKMYRKELKRVQESIAVASSAEELRRLEAERARLESELGEVS